MSTSVLCVVERTSLQGWVLDTWIITLIYSPGLPSFGTSKGVAEVAGLMRSGKAVIPFITTAEAPAYWSVVKLVRDVIGEFLHDTASEMKAFLKDTLPGMQGVS